MFYSKTKKISEGTVFPCNIYDSNSNVYVPSTINKLLAKIEIKHLALEHLEHSTTNLRKNIHKILVMKMRQISQNLFAGAKSQIKHNKTT